MIWGVALNPLIPDTYREISREWSFDELIVAHLALNASKEIALEESKDSNG
jgi:hypothetical protein